jgi:hypothetical protein
VIHLVKKWKMENYLLSQKFSSKISESLSNQPMPQPDTQDLRTSEIKLVSSFEDSCSSSARKQSVTTPPKYPQKLLLPKLEVAMVKLAVMQFSPMPVFVPTVDSSAQPVVVGVDQGYSAGADLVPLSVGTLILGRSQRLALCRRAYLFQKLSILLLSQLVQGFK